MSPKPSTLDPKPKAMKAHYVELTDLASKSTVGQFITELLGLNIVCSTVKCLGALGLGFRA